MTPAALPIALYFAAYIAGGIPFGVLVARMKGVDILSLGSASPGATNVYRMVGPIPALIVFLLDLAKGFLPAYFGMRLLGSPEQGLACGVVAVVGHSFSPFLRFRGGKGVATGFGVLLGIRPDVGLSAFGIFLIVLAIWRYVSLASISSAFALIFFGWLYQASPVLMLAFVALGGFVIYRHWSNVQRLLAGTERKLGSAPVVVESSADDVGLKGAGP